MVRRYPGPHLRLPTRTLPERPGRHHGGGYGRCRTCGRKRRAHTCLQIRPEGGFAQRPQPVIFLLIKNPEQPRDRTPTRRHASRLLHFHVSADICQDGRSGGFTELLARAEVSHDALIDFPSEKAFTASDDVPFRPSIRPASDDRVDRRLVIAHTDHDGSMEGGVRLSVAAPIEAVSTGGHPRGGGDGTRAAELGKGGFRANPLRVIPEDNEHRGGGVGANGEALPEGGRRLGGESGEV